MRPDDNPNDWYVDRLLQRGHWYACAQLEREPDSYVLWHTHDCDICSFKAGVQLKTIVDAGPWPRGEHVYELYTRYLGRFAKAMP